MGRARRGGVMNSTSVGKNKFWGLMAPNREKSYALTGERDLFGNRFATKKRRKKGRSWIDMTAGTGTARTWSFPYECPLGSFLGTGR